MLFRIEVEAVVVCITLDILGNKITFSLSFVVVVGTDLFPKKWEAESRSVSKQHKKAEDRYCTVVTVIPYRIEVLVITTVLYMYVDNIMQ